MSSAGPRVLGRLRRALVVLLGCSFGLAPACYDGPGPREPPPGSPGGFCYPGDLCDGPPVQCDPVGDYCYDVTNPCRGVFCGDHGVCTLGDDKLPTCVCEPGYLNEPFKLYCEPYGE